MMLEVFSKPTSLLLSFFLISFNHHVHGVNVVLNTLCVLYFLKIPFGLLHNKMNNKFSLNPFYSACKQRWDTLERSEAFLLTCYKTVTLCYSWYIRVNPVTPQSGQHQHFMVKQSVFFFIVSLLPWGGQGLGISGISFNTYNLLPAIPHMWNNIDRISANTIKVKVKD